MPIEEIAVCWIQHIWNAVGRIAIPGIAGCLKQSGIIGMGMIVMIGVGGIIPLTTGRILIRIALQIIMHQNLLIPVGIGRKDKERILRRPIGKCLNINGITLRFQVY